METIFLHFRPKLSLKCIFFLSLAEISLRVKFFLGFFVYLSHKIKPFAKNMNQNTPK